MSRVPARSACGFFLYQYGAFLDIRHQYPMMLYQRDYKTMRYNEVEFTVQVGDSGENCLF